MPCNELVGAEGFEPPTLCVPNQMRYQAALRPDSSDYPTAPPSGARDSIRGGVFCLLPARGVRCLESASSLSRSARARGGRSRPVARALPALATGPPLKPARSLSRVPDGGDGGHHPQQGHGLFGRDDHNLSVRQGHQQIDLHQPVLGQRRDEHGDRVGDHLRVAGRGASTRSRSSRHDDGRCARTPLRPAIGGSLTSSLVNTFDRENRLVQETGESSAGGTFTTTYTSWDEAGRPTAGKTVSRGNINALTLAYDSSARNVDDDNRHRPAEAGVRADFRRRRQPGGELVRSPGGMTNGSTTTTTASEKICR